jgi:hypothetical protein
MDRQCVVQLVRPLRLSPGRSLCVEGIARAGGERAGQCQDVERRQPAREPPLRPRQPRPWWPHPRDGLRGSLVGAGSQVDVESGRKVSRRRRTGACSAAAPRRAAALWPRGVAAAACNSATRAASKALSPIHSYIASLQ